MTPRIWRTTRCTTQVQSGAERNYTFELTTEVKPRAESLYVLRFRYPSDLKTAAAAMLSVEEQALQAKLTALKLERGVVEGVRNLAYTVQGATPLQPSEVSDNGRFTVMRFPAGQPIPAVYEVTADGTESLVPFDVRGEFVVVHDTARQFRLRRGARCSLHLQRRSDLLGCEPRHAYRLTGGRSDRQA